MRELEHGSFEMTSQSQVITLKVFGGWNFETTSRWCSEYKSHINAIRNKPWARLMDLTYWELTTPDVVEIVDEVNTWANQNNQKYEVVICSMAIQEELLRKVHQILTNVEIKFCENIEEATTWLNSKDMKI